MSRLATIYTYIHISISISEYIYIYGWDVVPKRSFIGSPVIFSLGTCPAMQNRYRGQWQKKRFGRMAPGDPAVRRNTVDSSVDPRSMVGFGDDLPWFTYKNGGLPIKDCGFPLSFEIPGTMIESNLVLWDVCLQFSRDLQWCTVASDVPMISLVSMIIGSIPIYIILYNFIYMYIYIIYIYIHGLNPDNVRTMHLD